MTDYDCAIIGAGFVGATAAIALARCGYSVIVIDGRNPLTEVGREDVRGIALSASSRRIFSELDLWGVLAQRAMPIREIRVSERGSFPSVCLSTSEFGIDAFAHVVPADYLLRSIENKLLREVKVAWGSTLENYSVDGNNVSISLRDKGGQSRKYAVSLLIGADGVNSKVRALAGISSASRSYNQHAVVATLKVSGIKSDLAVERFTSSGPLALLPSSEERHVLIRCTRTDQLHDTMALSDAEFLKDTLSRFARPLGEMSELGTRRAHPLMLSQSEAIIAERVALLGAAAVTVHPNAAQGLNLGLRDVVDLCECIANISARSASTPLTDSRSLQAQLDNFARKRTRDHKRIVRLTDGLARGFTSTVPGVDLVRSLGLLAAKLSPGLRREIILHGMGEGRVNKFPFPSSKPDVRLSK